MVGEGHVIGDHSYDHMAHNTINDSPRCVLNILVFTKIQVLLFQKCLCWSGRWHHLVWSEEYWPCYSGTQRSWSAKTIIVIFLQIILSQATRRMPSTLWRTPCGTTSDSPSLTTGGWGLSSMTATPVQSQHPRESELKTKYSVCEVIITFSNGVELAKALNNEGASVFGWDMEWNMNYNINRL